MKVSYQHNKDALEYIESRKGLDGRFLIEILKKHLKPRSTALELGMGPGFDLDILNETFKATGSDYSKAYLDIYRQNNPKADLLQLDARTLETERKFDCIYSNKVLHHLSKNDLKKSLKLQKNLLNKNGILFHTFWLGEKQETFNELEFNQYQIDELRQIVKNNFNIIETNTYIELNLNDSIYLILELN